ncbi:hypothetical protein [Collimonas sp. PA-H2]|uniref:hypothetical protein n=1 Tax=Collimonas sp. PA-H2 TaxID=1881062 RepID=UPI00118061B8|nr:hypothetical protein [Collimonas sp. PA-H2]
MNEDLSRLVSANRYETLHWSLINIFARLFGIMALLVGFAFGLAALLQFWGAGLSTPGVSALENFFLSAFSLALAATFLTVRPYRLDVAREDSNTSDKPGRKLGWWTGTPKRKYVGIEE